MKNALISIFTLLFLISCAVGESMVIDRDWAFKKDHKIKWGDNNCSTVRDNEDLQKLHAWICPSFKSLVVDSFNEGYSGVSIRPPVGYYKKAAQIFIEENKTSSCSIIKTEELVPKNDMEIRNFNHGWVFYYEC